MILSVKKNNKIGIIVDAYNEFFSYKETKLFLLYVCLYALYSLNIIPGDIVLGLITVVFTSASMKGSLMMYLFFTLWENVTVFSFGVTLSLILQLIMFGKIVLYYLKSNKTVFYNFFDLTVCALGFLYGIMDYLIGTGGLSGVSIAIDIFIIIYAHSVYRDESQSSKFWEAVFFTIMVSTIIAVIYGFFNDTSSDRWISGLGFVKQLYGTIGTARIGMFLCASLIYPVFYLNKPLIKGVLCILLCIGVFMTFSLTSMICLIVFWSIVLLFKDRNNFRKNLKKLGLVVILIMTVVLLWGSIREISIIKPIVIRIDVVIEGLKSGDMSAATSSRSYLADIYLNDFENYSLFGKLFGSFYSNRFRAIMGISGLDNYAHNSFIDILLYTGILGIISLFAWIVMKVRFLKGREEFLPVVLLKLIFLLTGFSVSMLTNCYWFTWMIL